jgi:hypothetical protein
MSATFDHLAAVSSKLSKERSTTVVDHERLWGPILMDDARACGAPAPVASVLLRPTQLLASQSVYDLLPAALFPTSSDTAASLSQRLSESDFLDATLVPVGGNARGGAYILLNSTQYPQPRRKSWSVCKVGPRGLGTDTALLWYPHSYHRTCLSAPMPMPVFALGVELWRVARPYLTDVCQQSPMNHCELLCYYTLFRSRMGRHRDNFKASALGDCIEGRTDPRVGGTQGAQVADSSVLIWSVGNAPMVLSLSFAASAADRGTPKKYDIHPRLSFELNGGTLFVFAPLDDLFYCHESSFTKLTLEAAGPAGHRFAFVYRWLPVDGLRTPSLPPTPPPPRAADRVRWWEAPLLALREVRVYTRQVLKEGLLPRGLRLDQPPLGAASSLFFAGEPPKTSEGKPVPWRPLMVVQGHLLGPKVNNLPRALRSYSEYTLYADPADGWMLLGNPRTDAWALINSASPPFKANAVMARVQHLVHPDELEGKAAPPDSSAGWMEFTLVWILQVGKTLGDTGEILLDYGDGFAGGWTRTVYGEGIPEANGPELIAYSQDHFHCKVSAKDIVRYGIPSDQDGIAMRNQLGLRCMPPKLTQELVASEPVCAPMTYL